jgi:hypothetical protein
MSKTPVTPVSAADHKIYAVAGGNHVTIELDRAMTCGHRGPRPGGQRLDRPRGGARHPEPVLSSGPVPGGGPAGRDDRVFRSSRSPRRQPRDASPGTAARSQPAPGNLRALGHQVLDRASQHTAKRLTGTRTALRHRVGRRWITSTTTPVSAVALWLLRTLNPGQTPYWRPGPPSVANRREVHHHAEPRSIISYRA